jgi:hypothetical protein
MQGGVPEAAFEGKKARSGIFWDSRLETRRDGFDWPGMGSPDFVFKVAA